MIIENGLTVSGSSNTSLTGNLSVSGSVSFTNTPSGLITNGNGTLVTQTSGTNYTALSSVTNLIINSGTSFTVTLPALSTMKAGQFIVVYKQTTASFTLAVTPNSSDKMMLSGTGLTAAGVGFTAVTTVGGTWMFLNNGAGFWTVIRSA